MVGIEAKLKSHHLSTVWWNGFSASESFSGRAVSRRPQFGGLTLQSKHLMPCQSSTWGFDTFLETLVLSDHRHILQDLWTGHLGSVWTSQPAGSEPAGLISWQQTPLEGSYLSDSKLQLCLWWSTRTVGLLHQTNVLVTRVRNELMFMLFKLFMIKPFLVTIKSWKNAGRRGVRLNFPSDNDPKWKRL